MSHFHHPKVELRMMPLSTFFRCFFPGHTANPSGFIKCWCTFITANQSGPIWKRKVVFNSTKLNLHPPKTNMEAEKKNDPWTRRFSKGWPVNFTPLLTMPPMTGLPWRDAGALPPQTKGHLESKSWAMPATHAETILQAATGWNGIPSSRWVELHHQESWNVLPQ